MTRLRLLQAYYLGTPAFLAADLVWGAPVRVSFVEDLRLRLAYYGFCLLCGVLCWKVPRAAPFVGLGEGAVNFALVVFSIMLPVLGLYDRVFTHEPLVLPFTGFHLANAALSGFVLVLSLQRRQAAVVPAGHPLGGARPG